MGVALDSGNLGVTAESLALIGLVNKYCPDARIALLTEHPDGGAHTAQIGDRSIPVEIVNGRVDLKRPIWNNLWFVPLLALYHRLRPRPSRSRWIEILRDATWVGELQAGDAFSDEFGLRDFIAECLPTFAAIGARRPPYLLPQSFGPPQTAAGLHIARFIARRSRGLFARDLASVHVGISLAGRFPAPPVEFCPDLAFTLPSAPIPSDAIEPALPDGAPVIGLNINGGLYNDGFARAPRANFKLDYTGLMPELARALLEAEPDTRLLMIPYMNVPSGHRENDREAGEHVAATLPPQLRERVHFLRDLADPCRIRAAIGRCTFFIGARLHACIAALSQGIPAVGIADNWRIEGIFATVGMQTCIVDARYDESAAALRLILRQAREREKARARLAEQLPAIHARIDEVFSRLLAPARRPFL